MMYQNKLAVAIKSNGKILREFKDTVYVPFQSEYSILIKNLNTKRVLVNVFLDGDNAVPNGLVINANQELNLERWVKNNNLSEGNKFKFIERTSNIENHRGIKLEDGIIRVEFQYEVDKLLLYRHDNNRYHDSWNSPIYSNTVYGIAKGSSANDVTCCVPTSVKRSLSNNTVHNDAGITVAGGKSTQKFSTVSNFQLEPEKHTIVLKLLGETPDNKPILEPITVKTKQQCDSCGKMNKATAKFCQECGTSLTVYA